MSLLILVRFLMPRRRIMRVLCCGRKQQLVTADAVGATEIEMDRFQGLREEALKVTASFLHRVANFCSHVPAHSP